MPFSHSTIAPVQGAATACPSAPSRQRHKRYPEPRKPSGEALDLIRAFREVEPRAAERNDPDSYLYSLEAWSERILSKERYPLRAVSMIAVQPDGNWEPASPCNDEEQAQLTASGGEVLPLCDYLERIDPLSRAALAATVGAHAACARAALDRQETRTAMTFQRLAVIAYWVYSLSFEVDPKIALGRSNASNLALGRRKAMEKKATKAQRARKRWQRKADEIWARNLHLSASSVAALIAKSPGIAASAETIRKAIKRPGTAVH